jgi:hypothetical protein
MNRIIILLVSLLSSFVALSQTPCDSLDIQVRYSAFADTLIEVSVVNHSQVFYSYPGFVIYDTNGDTVAKEDVNLFGLGPSSQHVLKVFLGMLTTPNFSGTIELYSGFYSELECSYNMNFHLCPDTCINAYPYLVNMGGAISFGTVNWTLQNQAAQTVATGSFTLGNGQQIDQDTLCLTSGSYTLTVSGLSGPMGGQPYFGISTHFQNAPEPQKQYTGAAAQLPFDFYNQCITTDIKDLAPNNTSLNIFSSAGRIHMANRSGRAIGDVAVFSITGQLMWSGTVSSSHKVIDLDHLSPGIYAVRVTHQGTTECHKLFIAPQD